MTLPSYVAPANIQSELDLLWNNLANKNKMSASLFNLIFFTKKSARSEYIQKIAHKVIEKFPARVFLISLDPEDDSDCLKTAVSVLSTEQGQFDITCDFIELFASKKTEEQIPFLLLPHLKEDLPVFLVWAEDPSLESHLCSELKRLATRIIFDSESTKDLASFASSIFHSLVDCEIADLNWARLESWRDLMSATFCDEEKIDQLMHTSTVNISYNAQETPFFCHTKIQSIYLQAWMASRLKWTPLSVSCKEESCSFSYEKEGRTIEVLLQGVRQSTLPPGMILSVDLKTTKEEHFLFTRDLEVPHQISLEYNTKQECRLPTKFTIAKGESGQSLVKEICHKGTSQHYLDVLKLIVTWGTGLC